MIQLIAKHIALSSKRGFLLFIFNMVEKNLPIGDNASEKMYRVRSKYTVF